MKNRIIALPIETIVRELDAKILLSAFLLNEGFDVLIGSRGGIFTELKYLKNVDIIYKSIFCCYFKLFKRFEKYYQRKRKLSIF